MKIVWPASYLVPLVVSRLMVGLESIWWLMAISLQPQPYEDTSNSHGRPKTLGFLHKTLKTQNNHHLSYFWPRKPFKANSSFPLFSLISFWFCLSNLIFRVYLSSWSSTRPCRKHFQSTKKFYKRNCFLLQRVYLVFSYIWVIHLLLLITGLGLLCDSRNSGSPSIERVTHTHWLREPIKGFTTIFTINYRPRTFLDHFDHLLRTKLWRDSQLCIIWLNIYD